MSPITPNRQSHHNYIIITVWLLGDTIAWTLGRIAQFHPNIVPVKQLMPLLCEKLRDVPRVSANICWNVQVVWWRLRRHTHNMTTCTSQCWSKLSQHVFQYLQIHDCSLQSCHWCIMVYSHSTMQHLVPVQLIPDSNTESEMSFSGSGRGPKFGPLSGHDAFVGVLHGHCDGLAGGGGAT